MRVVSSFRGWSPQCLCLCMPAVWFCLPARAIVTADCVGFGGLLSFGGGDLCRRSAHGSGGHPVVGNGTAGLSVPFLGVWGTAVFRWESSVWLTASSPMVPGVRRSTGVGSTPRLFTNVLGGPAGQRTSNGSCCQPAAGRGHYVVQSSDLVTDRHVVTSDVVPNDGFGHRTDDVSTSRGC